MSVRDETDSIDVQPSNQPKSLCRHCGSHVTADFRRVFCGNDETPYACPQCVSKPVLNQGAAANPERRDDLLARNLRGDKR